MNEHRADALPSAREKAHADLLPEALKRPGIREMILVYGDWRQADRALGPFREATRQAYETTTTDHTKER